MIRSFAFTTRAACTADIEMFLMPTLLSDTNLFLWVDLEDPTAEETKFVLEDCFISIRCRSRTASGQPVAQGRGVYRQGGGQVRAVSVHGDSRGGLQPQGRRVRHERTEFLPRQEFSGDLPRRAAAQRHDDRGTRIKGTMHIARAPDRVAHTLLDSIVDNYKPALEELSLEIAELEQQALQTPGQGDAEQESCR